MKDQKPSLDVDFDINYDNMELLVAATARMQPRGLTAAAGFSMTREAIHANPVGAIMAFAKALAAFYERNTAGVAVQAQDYKAEGDVCALHCLRAAS